MARCDSLSFGFGENGLGDNGFGGIRSNSHDPDNLTNISEAWDDGAIPLSHRSTNWRVVRAIATELDCLDEDITAVDDAIDLPTATGARVDLHADLAGLNRQSGESDDKLKFRLRGALRAGLSTTTTDELIEIAAILTEQDERDVSIGLRLDRQPSVAYLDVPSDHFNDTTLTGSEVNDLLNDSVKAAGRFDIRQGATQSNAFTVKSSGTLDDPDKGLTSDSISTGGKLLEEV